MIEQAEASDARRTGEETKDRTVERDRRQADDSLRAANQKVTDLTAKLKTASAEVQRLKDQETRTIAEDSKLKD
ncbi:MAG: hypothetical protein V2I33_17595 [Kangiellaceae bacterium]|nr:hypothetical protein [Kangiellaceae bacterium]